MNTTEHRCFGLLYFRFMFGIVKSIISSIYISKLLLNTSPYINVSKDAYTKIIIGCYTILKLNFKKQITFSPFLILSESKILTQLFRNY